MQIHQVGEKSWISWRIANYSTNQAWFNNVSGGNSGQNSNMTVNSNRPSLIFIYVNCESNEMECYLLNSIGRRYRC